MATSMDSDYSRQPGWSPVTRRKTKPMVGHPGDHQSLHPIKTPWDRDDLFDLFTCPACSHPIKDPVTLTCGYTVCMTCQGVTRGKSRSNTTSSTSSSSSEKSNGSTGLASDQEKSETKSNSGQSSSPPSPGALRSRLARFFSGSPSVTSFSCPVPQCELANHKADEALASCGITGPAAIEMLSPRIDVTVQRLKASIDTFYDKIDAESTAHAHTDRIYPVLDLEDENADPIMLRSKPEYAPNTSGNATPEDCDDSDNDNDSTLGVTPSIRGFTEEPRSLMYPHGRPRSTLRKQAKRRRPRSDDSIESLVNSEKLRAASLTSTCADLIASELECQVCYLLLHEPITTPCGHSFCKGCLSRSVDHSNTCPICRFDFPGYLFFAVHPTNKVLENVMKTVLLDQRALRQKIIDDEMAERQEDTPIFICTLAFPYMPIYLHIFEPRYRLMLRRCVDSNSGFAMMLPGRDNGVNNYGTMLDIKSIKQLADGRSLVELVGNHRIRVMSRSSLDGYTVGKTERIDDISDEAEQELERIALDRNRSHPGRALEVATCAAREAANESTSTEEVPVLDTVEPTEGSFSGPPLPANESAPARLPSSADAATAEPSAEVQEEESTEELISVCRSFISSLRSGSAPWLLQRLNSTYGTEPLDNRAAFSWWMAAVIPISEEEKARLLPIRVVRLRFKLIVFWIRQLSEQWWFTRGCTIG